MAIFQSLELVSTKIPMLLAIAHDDAQLVAGQSSRRNRKTTGWRSPILDSSLVAKIRRWATVMAAPSEGNSRFKGPHVVSVRVAPRGKGRPQASAWCHSDVCTSSDRQTSPGPLSATRPVASR